MFLSTNTCDGKRDCINKCPTKAIKLIGGKAFSCLTCGVSVKISKLEETEKDVLVKLVVSDTGLGIDWCL